MLKLREIRKRQGMTQKELGALVGSSEASLSFYESGKQMPDLDKLVQLANALGVSTDELLDHNQNRPENDDVWSIRERLRNDPNFRGLYSVASKAKPEQLRAATAMLKSFESDSDDWG